MAALFFSGAPSSRQISDNFTVAKFFAIVLVSAGHYFEDTFIWVPVTVGLFIFAFSSGYFTALKHRRDTPLGVFWKAKLERLGPPLIVINLFLAALFLIQGREGIWHPHTLLGVTGFTGLLNWLHIPNQSPFGAGLWFMTVLLLFYIFYPVLAKLLTTSSSAIIFLIISATACTLGHIYAAPPYMLWPTVFGFCVGVTAGRLDWHPSKFYALALGCIAFLVMLALNASGLKQYNVLLIVVMAIASVAILLSVPFPPPMRYFTLLSASILEIYLIHGYLFFHPVNRPAWVGYLLSMLLIFIISILLNRLSQMLSDFLASRKARS